MLVSLADGKSHAYARKTCVTTDISIQSSDTHEKSFICLRTFFGYTVGELKRAIKAAMIKEFNELRIQMNEDINLRLCGIRR